MSFHLTNFNRHFGVKFKVKIKRGFKEGYTQRLIEGNIFRLRLSRLTLYGSEGGDGGQGEIIYSSMSRKKSVKFCTSITKLCFFFPIYYLESKFVDLIE